MTLVLLLSAIAWYLPPAANGCRYVFLDVGSNVGMHVRFLFEPERFPLNKYGGIFNRTFPRRRSDRQDICAFGFEPNPKHKERLNQLQKQYSEIGWRVQSFHEAVAAKEGRATFWHVNDVDDTIHNEWGFSAQDWSNHTNGVNASEEMVPTIDFAAWTIHNVHMRNVPSAMFHNDPPPTVVMKMDVEGSEYEVLANMLVRGALCDISLITIEWHAEHMCQGPFCAHAQKLKNMVNILHDVPGCQHVRLQSLDDESYSKFAKGRRELL